MGSSNEVRVVLEGVECTALLDTGSMVSTMAASLASKLDLEVMPIDGLLKVEGAGGHTLQYQGYVEATTGFPGLQDDTLDALYLVVPDTHYHERVPVLVGTNILDLGFSQNSKDNNLPLAWKLAFQSISSQKKIDMSPNSIGDVKTTKAVTIQPEECVLVQGLTRAAAGACLRLSVLADESKGSPLPGGLVLSPSLLHLKPGVSTEKVAVQVTNFSKHPVTIPSKSSLCELHQVSVVPTDYEKLEDCPAGDQPMRDSLRQNLDSQQVQEVESFLDRWQEALSLHDLDAGRAAKVKHRIRLTSPEPFKDRSRRIPPSMVEQVRKHLQEMLDFGVITRSESPYASNIVLVKKKDGSLRFCIDFRKLNSLTVRDAYALPRIDDTLDALQGAQWFSTLDLKSSYWQVEIAEEDQHKTAFTAGPLGFYECKRMPFGLTNAPATFQRLMESCMGDLYLKYCLLYLDDIVVYSKTYEEHLERLEAVFERLKENGLKLKPSKCKLFQRSICYLGHVISKDGVSTDPEKIKAVQEWPVPKNSAEVQSFLGFIGFYR